MRIQDTPEHRGEIVAGLRAMAQFLEDRLDVPCPQSVQVQHSVLDPYDVDAGRSVPAPDAEKIDYVHEVAARLGVAEQVKTSKEQSYFFFPVAARTTYVVNANLGGEEHHTTVTPVDDVDFGEGFFATWTCSCGDGSDGPLATSMIERHAGQHERGEDLR